MATRRTRRIDYDDPRGYEYWDVDIDLLVPDPENPRIPPQESSNLEIMLALFWSNPSGLYKLAEDLAKVGTNPAGLLNVTRSEPNRGSPQELCCTAAKRRLAERGFAFDRERPFSVAGNARSDWGGIPQCGRVRPVFFTASSFDFQPTFSPGRRAEIGRYDGLEVNNGLVHRHRAGDRRNRFGEKRFLLCLQ